MNSAQGLYDDISLAEGAIGDALDRISYCGLTDADCDRLGAAKKHIEAARAELESLAGEHDTTDLFCHNMTLCDT